MEVKDDRFLVDLSPRDETGRQLDPEEKPAVHELLIDVAVTRGGVGNGEVVGHLGQGGAIQQVGTVAEFAHEVQHTCSLCRWFDNKAWLQILSDLKTSNLPKDYVALGQVYGQFIDESHGPNDPMVEAAVRSMGQCHALTAFRKDVCVTVPEAGCPTDPGPKGEDLTELFEPRDSDTVRQATTLYDALMRAAQGK